MAQFYVTAERRHRLLLLRGLRLFLEDGTDHFEGRSDPRDQERDRRELHKSPRDESVGTRESHVVVKSNSAADRGTVHNDRPDEADRRRDHAVHLDDHRRVVQVFRLFGIEPSPAGERALLGSRELDLLDPGDHRVVHAALLRGELHGFSRDLRVDQCRDDRKDYRDQGDHQRRHDQRRCIVEDLRDIYERKYRSKSGG